MIIFNILNSNNYIPSGGILNLSFYTLILILGFNPICKLYLDALRINSGVGLEVDLLMISKDFK